ncbi:MAG: hypothetical protein U1F49_15040 [Rubrivivax sp.]
MHNVPALRHDRNVVAALQAPQADYVWLLGDGALVDERGAAPRARGADG